MYRAQGADWTGICKKGRSQSPIDIKLEVGNPHGDFEMKTIYDLYVGAVATNDGTTIRWRGNFGRMIVQGVTYAATEFVFNSPSEHKIDGRQSPLEMQIIHKRTVNPDKRVRSSEPKIKTPDYAILSVLFYESITKTNDFLDSIGFTKLPSKGRSITLDRFVNMYAIQGLQDNEGGYFSYAGSLSRPPCTEGVKRFILRTYQPINSKQLAVFNALYQGNSRAIQRSHGRGTVLHAVNLYPEVSTVPRQALSDGTLLPL